MPNEQLIQTIADRELADFYRLAAVKEVSGRALNNSQREELGEILREIAGSNRHSIEVRRCVIELIEIRFGPAAAEWLGSALVKTAEPDLENQLVAALGRLGDPRAIDYIILHLASIDDERSSHKLPGYETIENIAGAEIDKVLRDRLTGQDQELHIRLAGLQCLIDLQGAESVKRLVKQVPDTHADELLQRLHYWADTFDYLPRNRREYLQCSWQKFLVDVKRMDQLKWTVKQLQEDDQYDYRCGDNYVLLQMDQDDILTRRETLVATIGDRLNKLEHRRRVPRYRGAPDDRAEDFAGQSAQLTFIDLIRINWLLEALAHESLRTQLGDFQQADLADENSEVGGLCFREKGKMVFRAYEPQRRAGDQRYIESPQMIQDSWFCLGRWHCHAVAGREGLHCGPGMDDLAFVQDKQSVMIIVSVVGSKCYNVDYVNRRATVIDLGNYYYEK